jgi:hypothetical protein
MADSTQFTSGARSGGTSASARPGDGSALDAERMIENAKNMGNQLVGAARDSATSMMDEQRNRAADQIASIAGMVRNSVQSLDRQSAGTICQYADDTARQIDNFAETLRTRSWGELAGDVEDFARRWPVVFMASAIGAGALVGRFLVSSGTRVSRMPAPMQSPPSTTASAGMSDKPLGGTRYDYGSAGGTGTGTGTSSGTGTSTGNGTGGTTPGFAGSGPRESF